MTIEKKIAKAMTSAATYEAMGEEAIEFGQACYKMARWIRGESPVDDALSKLEDRIGEEWGDLINVLQVAELKDLNPKVPDGHVADRMKRWHERLKKSGKIKDEVE